jgi:predicted kinase
MAALPAIRIRSDLERKRLFGLDELADSESGVAAGIYTPEASEAVYRRLAALASLILGHGHNVILDAAFLSSDERLRAMETAAACGSAVVIVHADAPPEVLRERLKQRAAEAGDASEADTEVLDHQLASAEVLTAAERLRTVDVDTTADEPIASLVGRIRALSGTGKAD